MDLTEKQMRILRYLIERWAAGGPMATLREVAAEFGFRSNHTAACHLDAIEKKGAIKRTPMRGHRIVLTHPTVARLRTWIAEKSESAS